jgi:hypothetical protein
MLMRILLALSAAAAIVAALVPIAPARVANNPLPDQYVATLNTKQQVPQAQGNGRATLRMTLNQRPRVSQATRPFKPGDPLTWRVAFSGLSGGVVALTLKAAAPGHTGRTLVTLCSPCASDAHGALPLNAPLAIALDQSPLCYVQSPCSRAEPDQFTVYVELETTRRPQGELRGQLRLCSTTPTFEHRGSCSPPGYPTLAGAGQ